MYYPNIIRITCQLCLALIIQSTLSFAVFAGNTKIYTVAFAQDTMANDWRVSQIETIKKELGKHPNINFIYTDAGGDSTQQIIDIENFIYQGIDVLITSPRNGAMSTPIISRVYQKGIPVILVTRSITNDQYTTYITPDDYSIAQDAAKYIVQHLNGKAKVLILRGIPTASTAIARTQGFLDGIKQSPGIEIIAIKDANYLRADAITAIEEVLASGKHFDAIYAQSDSMAAGARLALKANGVDPKDKLIIGIDYINEARDAIREGTQSASFLYPTCAEQVVDTVLRIIHQQPVPKKITVESKMITHDNVEDIQPIF